MSARSDVSPASRRPAWFFLVVAAAAIAALYLELSFRLDAFPGLHGDEAWTALRALKIADSGLNSVHGMNRYTGAIFPTLIAGLFTLNAPTVFWLRAPGVALNVAAVLILALTFQRRKHAAVYLVLLFSASLFFLFYSRIAWEVTALENFLIAVIIWTTDRILRQAKVRAHVIVLFFAAFAVGTLNHFIFSAAAISFAVAAVFLASKALNSRTSRLLLAALCNLIVQAAIVLVKPTIPGGRFLTHGLPTVLGTALLVGLAVVAYSRLRSRTFARLRKIRIRHARLVMNIRWYAVMGLAGCFVLIMPFNGVSFWGMVSGALVLERVASYVPNGGELSVLYVRLAALVLSFGWLVYRASRQEYWDEVDLIKPLLLIWPAVFLIVMQLETLGLSDRYFVIPQTIFFAALAVSIDDLPVFGRRMIQAVLVIGLCQSQLLFWREVSHDGNRKPLDFRYGFYFDTSRHFLRQEGLIAALKKGGYCAVSSKSYFISAPVKFALASRSCSLKDTAEVEYCDTCASPVPWFRITPSPRGN